MLFAITTNSKYSIHVFLPMNVRFDYWKRHKYSELDVLSTLKNQPPKVLLKLCMLLNIAIPAPCIKPCISSNDLFVFTGKMAVLNKVCDKIRKKFTFSSKDKLQADSLIPTHRVSKYFFKSVRDNLSSNDISFLNTNTFKKVNIYFDVLWIPINYEEGMITLRRIIPSEHVNQKLKKYILRAFKVIIDEKNYISTDEQMYVYSY